MIRPLTGLALLAPLALAACGGEDSNEPVGGVTASEAQALNDAAAMLDERAANSVVTLPEPGAITNAANASAPASNAQ